MITKEEAADCFADEKFERLHGKRPNPEWEHCRDCYLAGWADAETTILHEREISKANRVFADSVRRAVLKDADDKG